LTLGKARSGCRACIAIAGGIDVPPVLGSRSTFLPGQFGGYSGRSLRAGDVIPLRNADIPPVRRGLATPLRPTYGPVVRLIAGEHLDRLGCESHAALFGDQLRVSARSDRMGYRLEGATLRLHTAIEPLSSAVTIGTLQLPPGGDPILLMADHQTTGGYPVLGHVASVDFGAVAQLRPGASIRFTLIGVDEAQQLYRERERALSALRRALSVA
jgi:antagonist of KipI